MHYAASDACQIFAQPFRRGHRVCLCAHIGDKLITLIGSKQHSSYHSVMKSGSSMMTQLAPQVSAASADLHSAFMQWEVSTSTIKSTRTLRLTASGRGTSSVRGKCRAPLSNCFAKSCFWASAIATAADDGQARPSQVIVNLCMQPATLCSTWKLCRVFDRELFCRSLF